LIGFAGSLRRSELAALKVNEITRHRKGITLLIPPFAVHSGKSMHFFPVNHLPTQNRSSQELS
jgi:hypothetical protein